MYYLEFMAREGVPIELCRHELFAVSLASKLDNIFRFPPNFVY
jgi:hypothetical protein